MSKSDAPIRTPFTRLLLLWRLRYAPVLIWGIAVGLAFFLVGRQQVFVDAIGVAESQTTLVAPLLDGTVHSLAVDVLDEVTAGQVVGMMDDSLVRAELTVAESLLDQARAALEAESRRFAQEQLLQEASTRDDERRFVVDEERARLDHLDRVIQHETDKVDLERLAVQVKRQEAMRNQHVLDDATYDETRLAYEVLRTKVERDAEAIALAEANLKTAAERRNRLNPVDFDSSVTDAVLKSLQADIAAQQAAVMEVQSRREALVLRAPVKGRVASIVRRPGESMLAGDPIMTIVGEYSTRVMAYVDERAPLTFHVGDAVEVLSRTHPKTVANGTILKVGAHMEPFPLRLLTYTSADPMMPPHGIQVLVGELPDGAFRPGEALDLRLRAAS